MRLASENLRGSASGDRRGLDVRVEGFQPACRLAVAPLPRL